MADFERTAECALLATLAATLTWIFFRRRSKGRPTMTKRVYKFMKAEHAIGSLKKKRLKLSTIEDLNDPFDLCPLDTSHPQIAAAADAFTIPFKETRAVLCFSRNWDNLLLWSHYGDSHKGVCLGFDIVGGAEGANYDMDVHYQPNLLEIRTPADVKYELASRLLRTKHESWSYEQEVRMFAALNDPPDANGRHWIDFNPQLQLREVIIGPQCHPAISKTVQQAVVPYGDTVKLRWAGMRSDAFLLIKQDHPPEWHATVTTEPPHDLMVGCPEMWKPVYAKYKPFFDCAAQLAVQVNEIIKTPVQGKLLQVVGRMVAAASNAAGALQILVLNGYGHDAMKLARSLFEIEVNIAWFHLHPEEIEDFTEYHHIQQKQYYDMFAEEEKAKFPKERYDQMMAAYNAALPRFPSKSDPKRPRNEWCRVSLYARAKETGLLDLYRVYYGPASSIHHLDFAGLAASSGQDLLADMAPSWSYLDKALAGFGSWYRSVGLYDAMGNLGFKEKLENGPGAAYINACKTKAKS